VDYSIVTIVHHLRCSEFRPRWQNWLYARVEKQYLESVDAYIFNSNNTRLQVENLAGKVERSIVAYPAGDRLQPELPPDWIISRAEHPGPLQIIFLGNVIPRKGLHILLEALSLISGKKWQLSVVGSLQFDPNYVRQVKLRVQEYGMQAKIKFLGTLDEDDLKQVLLSSHLLVMPSYHEGFGIAYLEGMGFGLPAIASDSGGAAEIIRDGENGFLVPPGDAVMLSEYIDLLINDRKFLVDLSQGACERYARHPTWEDTSSQVHDFLKTLVRSGARL
jgi:glycosyltransferase involved in cell wall biosynthesis